MGLLPEKEKRVYRQAARKPSKEPLTDSEYSKAEALAGQGCGVAQLAGYFGFSKPTFEVMVKNDLRLKDAIERGRGYGNGAIVGKAFEMAMSGKHPAMTIFWLKCRMHWKEPTLQVQENDESYSEKDASKAEAFLNGR
jgi:hypothetical protein